MKLSVDSGALCEKLGDFEAMNILKEVGFDGVDFSFTGKLADRLLDDDYLHYADDMRRHLDAIGLECVQAHAPLGFGFEYARNLSEPKFVRLVRSIEVASRLGAKIIVVHSRFVPPDAEISSFEENRQFYSSLIPYCERFGICVAVENLLRYNPKCCCYHHIFPGTPDEMNALLQAIDSPWIVGCIDIGHASICGIEPQDFILNTDRQFLKALHVQDTDYKEDLHTLSFLGSIDWNAVVDALRKVGYEGAFNFELPEFFSKFPAELLPDALKMVHSVGRYLIGKF